jgi:hypothetical protein
MKEKALRYKIDSKLKLIMANTIKSLINPEDRLITDGLRATNDIDRIIRYGLSLQK